MSLEGLYISGTCARRFACPPSNRPLNNTVCVVVDSNLGFNSATDTTSLASTVMSYVYENGIFSYYLLF